MENEALHEWLIATTAELTRLNARLDSHHGVLVYLGEKLGIPEAKLEAAIAKATAQVHQARLERLEQQNPEAAAHIDDRELPDIEKFLD